MNNKPNYNLRKVIGWTVLIALSLLPVLLWIVFGPGLVELNGYEETTHGLGELFGLVGMTMFALTFVLSTRIPIIEDIFGGLDKVYITHGILGGTALIMILAHPIFLVIKFIPSEISTAAQYLLPSTYWSVNFGIIALIGMIILIYITLYTKIKYHKWKFTHEFLGVIFILAVLHMFLVRGTISNDNIFDGYYIYASIVSLIGITSFSYSLFLKNRLRKNAIYVIKEINQNKNIFSLDLVPEHKPLKYKSGQFVFLRFYNKELTDESHPFSIASKSNAEKMKIVIKKLGDFTENLEHLKVGNKVAIEGPYGRFHFKNYQDKEQIWIASGIGITPFIGMVQDLEEHDKDAKIHLYYAAGDKSEFIGYNFFVEAESKIKGFRFIPWNSKELGRISVNNIKDFSKNLNNRDFLICGSLGFKESIIKQLFKEGISRLKIHEEAFDFR